MTRGLFVVIVGIDGSGKTTLLNRLKGKGYLTSDWTDLREFPEIAHVAPEKPTDIRSILAPRSRAMFIGSHLVAEYEYLIEPLLQQGHSIIFDSYYIKLYAKEKLYQKADPIFFSICRSLPIPDFVIFINVDPNIALARRKNIEGGISPYEYYNSPIDEDFLRFQFDLCVTIKQLLNEQKWVEIDGNRDVEEVEAAVTKYLNENGIYI